ncbi:MAG: hypothetical protein JWO24_812 [Rhodospirillales bacterium]|jgi:hypothetical protein|nr:hypothetical protein [Rhodospirillales bacterium]
MDDRLLPRVVDPIETFIMRWGNAGGAEQANFQPFIVELCGVLGLRPVSA